MKQLWKIVSLPDNVPIVIMLFLVFGYFIYAMRLARRNDRIIRRLEADPELAKTHHRKAEPWHPSWEKTVQVWPYLLRIELLAAMVVFAALLVWSIVLDAPLEEIADPTLTPNPSKAPWYFLGLQEMLVYFDPWLAGVVFPTAIIIGLMTIPYLDVNPLGNGYYTWIQRRFSIVVFQFGFLVLWVLMVFIGTFCRGPGWIFFVPGQRWDHHRVISETNRDLHQMILPDTLWGNAWAVGAVGVLALLLYGLVGTAVFFRWFTRKFPRMYTSMGAVRFHLLSSQLLFMALLPIKGVLRFAISLKYILVTPWLNV